MKVFVRNLNEEQLEELHKAFDDIDRSKTGFITPGDIESAMRRNGYIIAVDEFQTLIQNFQEIGDGKLNYTQFLIAAMDRKRLINDETMWNVFKHFDIDNDGELTLDELKYALEKAGCFISENDFNEILEEFHLKAGQSMGFEKFRDIMMCKIYLGFSKNNSPFDSVNEDYLNNEDRRVVRRFSMSRMTNRRNSSMLNDH